MTSDHPPREVLRAFVTADLEESEIEAVRLHLVEEGCLDCLFAAREILAGSEPDLQASIHGVFDPARSEEARDESLERALGQTYSRAFVIEAERRYAPRLLATLERRPPALQREVIRTGPNLQLCGLAEHLCDESRRACFRDVQRALYLAELALEVADSLDPGIYLPAVTADQQALSRVHLGNALRVAGELFAAERVFQEALLLMSLGSRGPVVLAQVYNLLASLRIDQARYSEARRLLQEALEVFERLEQPRDVGKVLMKLGNADGFAGEAEEAVAFLRRAVAALEEAEDERLTLLAQHNLAYWLVDAGDPLEALAQYGKIRKEFERLCDEPALELRHRWLEARIHAGLDDFAPARRIFEEIRETAIRREQMYECAMISLELAVLHLNRGETVRVRELAEEMVPVFRSQDLHRHATAALALFHQAARGETATSSFTHAVFHYLRQARNNPYLRFQAPHEPETRRS